MQPTRRQMIVTVTGAALATLTAKPVSAHALAGQQHAGPPQPLPSPNAPQNQNAPLGLDTDVPVHNGEHRVAPATWLDIKSEAQKLLDLAADFKWQVNRANLNATLPLLLIQEARSIEKLAKQVQERMK